MLLAGVPRAGRSDIIVTLTRLLDPAFIRVQPRLADVRQQRTAEGTGDGEGDTTNDNSDADDNHDGPTTASDDTPTAKDATEVAADSDGDGYTVAAYGEVEVTLVDLDPELEQLCDGFLEPLDGDGQVDETGNAAPDAPLGVRLGYRVSYDPTTDSLEHVVFFPVRSAHPSPGPRLHRGARRRPSAAAAPRRGVRASG